MAEHLETTTTSIDSLNREIAERERIENELRFSEERFRILFEYAPDAYFLHDLQGRLLDVNKRAEQLTGYGREEQIGRTIIDLGAVPPSETDGVLSMAADNAAGRPSGPTEVILRHKDGSLITVEVMTLPIRIKGDPVVLGIARDVTERKRLEEQTRQLHRQMEYVLGATKTGLDIIDSQFHVRYIDPEWKKVYGDPQGKKCYEYFMGRNEVCLDCGVGKALEMKQPVVTEQALVRENNRVIQVTSTPFQNEQGEWLVAEVNVDITERKLAENRQTQLLQQLGEINQELKDFAHVVSHDLKAPLRAIGAIVDWLRADYADKLDDQGKEYLTLLTSRVSRMQGLIDGVLQYSRIGRTEQGTAPVDLGRLLPEIVENLGAPEHIAMEVEPDLPTVEADVTRITQVFQNLLSNAIKYMDKPQGRVTVACVAEEGFWKFRVSDNGPGIEPKHFDRIFKLFQTLAPRDSQESTGVGLTITKKIVETYGGKIWVESEVGQGSTFFFTFPKKKEAQVPVCLAAGASCGEATVSLRT